MKIQEQLLTEVKLGKIVEEDGIYYLVEVDKEGVEIDKFEVGELFEPYLNREFIKMKIEYSKEL